MRRLRIAAIYASINEGAESRFIHPPKAVALPPHSKVLRTKSMWHDTKRGGREPSPFFECE